jgi:hypothetical protein
MAGLKLHQDVDVAVGAKIVPKDGAKQSQPCDVTCGCLGESQVRSCQATRAENALSERSESKGFSVPRGDGASGRLQASSASRRARHESHPRFGRTHEDHVLVHARRIGGEDVNQAPAQGTPTRRKQSFLLHVGGDRGGAVDRERAGLGLVASARAGA